MSQQPAEHAPESFFVAQLAEHAKQSSVAAPATLASLVDNLRYLSHDELSLVEQAHAYATHACLLYTSPSPRDISGSRMPSSA